LLFYYTPIRNFSATPYFNGKGAMRQASDSERVLRAGGRMINAEVRILQMCMKNELKQPKTGFFEVSAG
jgi:hypothetical protein